ncbi:hypothetical protein BDR22DRAFT_877759 [Usnea florida]
MATINTSLLIANIVINLAVLSITTFSNPAITKSQCPPQYWNSITILLGSLVQLCWCLVILGLLRLSNLLAASHR